MEARYWIEAPPCEGCPICDVSPDEDLIREDLASHVDGPSSLGTSRSTRRSRAIFWALGPDSSAG